MFCGSISGSSLPCLHFVDNIPIPYGVYIRGWGQIAFGWNIFSDIVIGKDVFFPVLWSLASYYCPSLHRVQIPSRIRKNPYVRKLSCHCSFWKVVGGAWGISLHLSCKSKPGCWCKIKPPVNLTSWSQVQLSADTELSDFEFNIPVK